MKIELWSKSKDNFSRKEIKVGDTIPIGYKVVMTTSFEYEGIKKECLSQFFLEKDNIIFTNQMKADLLKGSDKKIKQFNK